MNSSLTGNVPVPTDELPASAKKFPAPAEKFPCADPGRNRKFARTVAGLQYKPAQSFVALIGNFNNSLPNFPAPGNSGIGAFEP
jgi:hypothetical protein